MSISYENCRSHLAQLGVELPPSEAHGLLCGLACSELDGRAKAHWLQELIESAEISPEALASHAGALHGLDHVWQESLAQLHDETLGFELMLPGEAATLEERTIALGDFCRGFVYGLGIGRGSRDDLPVDTRELVQDFQAIERGADADFGEDADNSDAEDFEQLHEYVRLGVLLVLEELKPVSAPPQHVH